jgi:uncharacterized membrane protein YcaP (DUF421 family)
MGLDDLMTAARGQGFRKFSNIDLAVLEPHGKISFFGKDRLGSNGSPEEPEVGSSGIRTQPVPDAQTHALDGGVQNPSISTNNL